MRRVELPDWIGKEIVIHPPNSRQAADYGTIEDTTLYTKAPRTLRGDPYQPDPKGRYLKVVYTGCEYNRTFPPNINAFHRRGYIPLSHAHPQTADDHHTAHQHAKTQAEANTAQRAREQQDANTQAQHLITQLGAGTIEHSTHTGNPRILLTLNEAQQLTNRLTP